MLTIKYSYQGNETLIEAARVSQHQEEGFPVVTATFSPDPDSETMTFGPVHAGVAGELPPTVYVMNRFGATVATYRL